MPERPDISTVMLCWNRVALSKRCLASYLETISVPHELFVIDNASTDGTGDWMRSLEGSAEVTGFVRTERNDPAAALNLALERCTGRYLHIMENDFSYLPGWDGYILDRFARIPDLGQIALITGLPHMRGAYHDGLVYLVRDNVGTTCVMRRELFFDDGVRVTGHYVGNSYPNDYDLSVQILRTGRLVAWPDVDLAQNVGITEQEFRRDPRYYVRDYALKLFSASRLTGQARRWLRGDFRDTATLVRRLSRACRMMVARAVHGTRDEG